jgi:hypothetical protein
MKFWNSLTKIKKVLLALAAAAGVLGGYGYVNPDQVKAVTDAVSAVIAVEEAVTDVVETPEAPAEAPAETPAE